MLALGRHLGQIYFALREAVRRELHMQLASYVRISALLDIRFGTVDIEFGTVGRWQAG